MEIDGRPLEEVSIAKIHDAMYSGSVTACQLVDAYLDRIDRYDQKGPVLNAVVTVNHAAREQARELDAALARDGPVGPLHGIPMVVKDCLETREMPTSFGSEAFAGYVAERDAAVIKAIRRAGAIVLAKTALPDWATSFFSYSSRSGETKNPYDVSRQAGGSSSGTGAAIAAGYAAIGLGTDTGGSVRVPASFCNLVGARSTPGMISRSGCSPLVGVQDTIGPMGRSVADVARVFDVLVGFDPADSLTYTYWAARGPKSYLEALDVDGLAGMRIGVVRNAFGSINDPNAAPVHHVIERALRDLVAGGAKIVDVTIPNLSEWLAQSRPIIVLRAKHEINRFLADRPAAPLKSVTEIVESGRYHERLDLLKAIADGPEDISDDCAYRQVHCARAQIKQAVLTVMASHSLNALVYPTCQILPPTRAETDAGVWTPLNFPTNTLISSQTGLPALTVPAGLTDEGLPVGLEILSRPYDEQTMFQVGYGLERVATYRAGPPALH